MQEKKQQLEADMEEETGSKFRKEYVMVVYCQPVFFLTYMQSTSCEMLDWMTHRVQSRFLREISDMQMISP